MAGMVAEPGRHIPIASATQHIVLAVPRNEHEPHVGATASSNSRYCSGASLPALSIPKPSVNEVRSDGRPSK